MGDNVNKVKISQRDRAGAFFDRFVEAFATFDAARIADLFVTPCVSLRENGSTVALTAREDVERYYQAAIDGYHHSGCRSCRWADLEVAPIGGRCMLATMTWELLGRDGSVLSTWRQSYNLADAGGGLKIFASATHVD
jgi:ketosteroid isomerase-like protein